MFKSLSPRARTLLGLSVIIVAFVLAFFFAPRYDDSSGNVTGDAMNTPVPTVTNLVSSLNVQRDITVQGLHIVVRQAMQATQFSDDSNNQKRHSTYTVRLLVDTKNASQDVVGYRFPDMVRLILPDGTAVHSRLVSVHTVIMPHETVTGYVDFPVAQQVNLADLKLQFTGGEKLALSA